MCFYLCLCFSVATSEDIPYFHILVGGRPRPSVSPANGAEGRGRVRCTCAHALRMLEEPAQMMKRTHVMLLVALASFVTAGSMRCDKRQHTEGKFLVECGVAY